MGIYMNAISGGNTFGPLICGFIVSNLSWRWQKWVSVIFTALNFFTILLFVPETRYRRETGQASVPACTSNEKIVTVDEKLIQPSSAGITSEKPLKTTWKQELSLWSGVSETNLAKMFVR
jgi:MFS family permease